MDTDPPVPVQVLSHFIEDYEEAHDHHEMNQGQLNLMQMNLERTFNENFRALNFKELQRALAIYKRDKKMVFKKFTDSDIEQSDEVVLQVVLMPVVLWASNHR
mgnify:CR=1 FL=1